jgi:hypothetical protein
VRKFPHTLALPILPFSSFPPFRRPTVHRRRPLCLRDCVLPRLDVGRYACSGKGLHAVLHHRHRPGPACWSPPARGSAPHRRGLLRRRPGTCLPVATTCSAADRGAAYSSPRLGTSTSPQPLVLSWSHPPVRMLPPWRLATFFYREN